MLLSQKNIKIAQTVKSNFYLWLHQSPPIVILNWLLLHGLGSYVDIQMVYHMIKYLFSFWLVRWLIVILIIMWFTLISKVSNMAFFFFLTRLLFCKYMTSTCLWQYFSSEAKGFSFCFIKYYKKSQTYIVLVTI